MVQPIDGREGNEELPLTLAAEHRRREDRPRYLSYTPSLFATRLRTLVYAARWHDRSKDFAVVRWYLHCQETAFPAAHQVEGYAHAMRERFGVIAGSLLGHKAASSLHQTACLSNDLKRGWC